MIKKIKIWYQSICKEEGQDLAEYALLLGLIALLVILAVSLIGQNMSRLFSELGSAVGTWF